MTGARDALRHGTHDLHDRVDAVFSAFRLDTASGYGAFLVAQAAAHIPCEAALDAADAATVLPDWPARKRTALLLEDLARIGLPAPAFDRSVAAAAPFSGAAAVLGGVYVLEGSRLGGAVLVRSVPPGLPRAFLGAQVPGAWRALMQTIDARLRSDAEVGAAVAAARQVFEAFERAALAHMKE